MSNRKLLALVFPEGLLLLLAAGMVRWGATVPAAAPVLRVYPLIVLAAGAVLAWRFQRGRLLLALTGLTLADRAMLWLAPPDSDAPFAGPVTVRAIAILLPASLAALAFVEERGVLTPTGLRRLAVLAAEAGTVFAVALLSAVYPESIAHALDVSFLPPAAVAWLPLGTTATLV